MAHPVQGIPMSRIPAGFANWVGAYPLIGTYCPAVSVIIVNMLCVTSGILFRLTVTFSGLESTYDPDRFHAHFSHDDPEYRLTL